MTPPNADHDTHAATPPVAADGRALPTAHTFSQFLQLVEDGDFHGDLSDALRRISTAMSQYVIDHGGKPTAKLKIGFEFKLDNGVFEIRATFDETLPKAPRGKTVVWSTRDNHFTPQNPKQMQMFGVRDASAPRGQTIITP